MYTYRIAAMAALGGLLFGFDTAIINGAIVFLKRQFGWTEWQTEAAAGSLLFGCVLGAIIAGGLSDWLGRRRLLAALAALFAGSSLGTALPKQVGTVLRCPANSRGGHWRRIHAVTALYR